MARLFQSPTKVATYQYLWPLKATQKLPYKEKYYLAKIFLELLRFLRHNESFCEKRRNLVWDQRQINNYFFKNRKYLVQKEKNPEMAKILAKLEGLIMSYCELLYY